MDSISCSVFPPVQPTSDSPAVNHPGKPDAGNPPVRFDAGAGTRGQFTGSLVPAYSTLLVGLSHFAGHVAYGGMVGFIVGIMPLV